MSNSSFKRGSGVYTCSDCGKRTRETGGGESGVELCLSCYDNAGLECEHQDGDHDDAPVDGCKMCAAASPHSSDDDCSDTLAVDGSCTVCGVSHGEPCDECGGRGYHAPDCSECG